MGPSEDALGHSRPFRPILGYWRDEQKTAEALKGAEFHTGDLGFIDDEGFVYIVDRLKDMIIRGGNNIYPAELERALMEDGRVESAYVVGVADERLGEIPFAFVVPADTTLSPDDLDDVVAGANVKLAKYKRIEGARLTSLDDLPKNAMNKILKTELAKSAGIELKRRNSEDTLTGRPDRTPVKPQ